MRQESDCRVLCQLLESFYLTEFRELKKHTDPSELSGQIVQEALDRGWQIVLATNHANRVQ